MLGCPYEFGVDMWSLGCIIYELIAGSPLFPAKDENELLEYIIVTIGTIPDNMLTNAKKFKQFYRKSTNFLGKESTDLIRSKDSSLGKNIKEAS